MPWTKVYTEKSEFEKACKKAGKKLRGITYREAIKEAIYQIMKKDKNVFVIGEGVDDTTGIFGTTIGLVKEFGKDRVIDIPIDENTMTGIAIGASLAGMKPIFIHMRMDFLPMSMDQILNHASKIKYMSGGRVKVPLIIRSIIGRGWGSAAQHSQSLQALFMHIPGLKVVMPATPYDVKGLFIASFKDESPIIFIEHRHFYEHIGYVPAEFYSVPIGKGIIRKEGKDITVIGISYMVYESIKASEVLEKEGINIEVIDLRTIKPIDKEIIFESVKKTGRLIICDTAWKTCGVSAEISALVSENCLKYLKSPVVRITSPDTPTPSSKSLEDDFYPTKDDIISTCKKILE